MGVKAWHGIILGLTALSLAMGCASSPYVGTGAALGGGLGALTGAAINNRNPWAGAAVGGLVGSALGAAGGYVVQQRQTVQQPPQGYYQPAPGYGAPAPRPYYGSSATPPAAAPSYSSTPPAADNYSQVAPPQPEGCRTPVTNAPYYY